MIKRQLIRVVSLKTGYEQEIVDKVIDAYAEVILYELQQKRSFRLRCLGTLRYIVSDSRNGFNPMKRQKEVFKGRNKIKFIPTKGLAKLLNPAEKN